MNISKDNALRAVLMFYGQVWGQAEKDRWFKLTGRKEATTRTLCDTVREALYEPNEFVAKPAIPSESEFNP